ncbi:MAG: type II CRISPR RNA-guided endonuclease Cas9 [Lachnospiraceae bacterium]|nr:type II CRISPR RNA-guided endonuclease Cas9 [Lachnospiraceae bacterium]
MNSDKIQLKEDYNIGLDIGTNSVGWAVTNQNGELLKFRKKNMWGARLFEEGKPAADCRVYRSTRRRYERRRQRIHLLQEMMEPIILPIDDTFFIRLEEAFLWKEDKKVQKDYILFNDKDYSDSDFYKDYPTIYHLRKYLVKTKEKADPRKIYLALHHMIKYRGNFLYQGQSLDTVDSVQKAFQYLVGELYEQLGLEWEMGEHFYEIESILKNKSIKKQKQEKIVAILTEHYVDKKEDKKYVKEITNAFLGYSFNLTVVMKNEGLVDESGKPIKVSFSDSKYEEMEVALQDQLAEQFTVVEALKQIYSWITMKDILKGEKYLCKAMVEKYETHRKELKELKGLFRKYLSTKEYREFFWGERKEKDKEQTERDKRQEEKEKEKYLPWYINYIKGTRRCSKEDLYKEIKRLLDDVAKEDPVYQNILEKMDREEYLSKQNEVANASLPYQLNQKEMEIILEQQGEFYPELKENKDKIMKLLTFRIPYYVGPLNPQKEKFSWMEKKAGKENEKIYPWNMEEVVDIDKTAEKFITRMTNFCTYLPEEKVLPKCSLLYSEYELLNELNKIRINNKLIPLETRNKLIKEKFKKTKKVTKENLQEWLEKNQFPITKTQDGSVKIDKKSYEISGFQKEDEFASSLSSYIDFTRIFGEVTEENRQMIEELIYWLTVFEERDIVKRKIKQKYGERINDSQMKQILKLRYTGWGKLSKKFLNGIRGTYKNEKKTIMEILWEHRGNLNLMQIINDEELGFKEIIEKNRKNLNGDEDLLELVQELHGSPALKRGIRQSMRIVNELIHIMGKEPKNIFIEFARKEGEKVRTKSRAKQLENCYKKLKEEISDYNVGLEKDLKDIKTQNKLYDERVFLYSLQHGKSLYSGEKLDIDMLDKYEVDHIIPQSVIKDDSIENKALVLKIENQKKGNGLVPSEYQNKQKATWKKLYDSGLMTKKKYDNLLRESLGSKKEQKNFIRRQLVETRQIVKHVANLLQEYYKNATVVEIKAGLNSDLREMYTQEIKDDQGIFTENRDCYTLLKSRILNDFHHAHDAYLTSIIGLYIKAAFPKMEEEIDYKDFKKYYGSDKNVNKKKFAYVLSKFQESIPDRETGEILWDGSRKLEYIKKIFGYRDCIITKKLEENTGAFYNETIYPKSGEKENTKLVPLKKGLDVKKYGGYQGGEAAYFALVSYQDKKKKKVVLQGIPIITAKHIEKKSLQLEDYLKEVLGVSELEVIKRKVQKNQLIEINNSRFYLTAATEVVNAKQFILDGKHQNLMRMVCIIDKENYSGYDLKELEKSMNELYTYYKEKIKTQYKEYESIVEKIDQSDVFQSIECGTVERLKQKGQFLKELLKITKANPECANLKKFDGKKLADRMGRKGGYTIKPGTTFIEQSITGLYERRFTI